MNHSNKSFLKGALLLSTLLGSLVLASCGAPDNLDVSQQLAMPNPAAAPEGGKAETSNAPDSSQPTNKVPQSSPQLVKTAEISLLVNSIDEALEESSKIVQQQQGDVLGLQDDKPQNSNRRETASMQIRVPQNKLDPTLNALAQLGIVQRRHLTAEDVSTQLVDFQARLRNLRQTESSLLKIMERSGSISDVLKVAQELSNVRQSIEQIDAQLKSLTNRVAYSTITLQLEAAVATPTSRQPLGSRMGNTWNNATQSVTDFTTNLVRLLIWLVAYSPYLVVLGVVSWLIYTQRKKHHPHPTIPSSKLEE
ncbi:MAG TPA: DUF4349 domain-containing protein [Cyanobacteria bacterium UBA12227]|nr:DUF4349 domain-containing protein [Cyanobacteria bacterium UBA12227]HAX86105.1 DUF4349 domain-containing protein [Cyanobacteria bacterium UBA11370]HBY79447.1 DUF4349 domain-containing protein [Cyanobacteria bacterium UBA11148]